MGELRKRGSGSEPTPESEKKGGRFGNLGDMPPSREPDIAEIFRQARKLKVVVDELVELHVKVSKDPTNVQAMRSYTEALIRVFELPTREALTILGTGVGALAELKNRGL